MKSTLYSLLSTRVQSYASVNIYASVISIYARVISIYASVNSIYERVISIYARVIHASVILIYESVISIIQVWFQFLKSVFISNNIFQLIDSLLIDSLVPCFLIQIDN
jgi:hypothetical protein